VAISPDRGYPVSAVNPIGARCPSAVVPIVTGTGKRAAEARGGLPSTAPLLHAERTDSGR
jgi:hypothetical protein